MKVKKILVVLNSSVLSINRLRASIQLAEAYQASITALYVIPFSTPAMTTGTMHGGWYIGEELMRQARDEALVRAAEIKATCENLMSNQVVDFEWVQQEGEIVSGVCAEARYHDVLVLGNASIGDDKDMNPGDISGILLSSASACLVVPDGANLSLAKPNNVLFAWNGSKEAIRALKQGMMLLENSNDLMVTSVYEHPGREELVVGMCEYMMRYLKVHQLDASSHPIISEGRPVGQSLHEYAEKQESDLIIMGAYGHSRLREMILGGVTKYVIEHTKIPILFAH